MEGNNKDITEYEPNINNKDITNPEYEPNINLGSLINLFLLGYDDKIYFDVYVVGTEIQLMDVRIIDGLLRPLYNCKILYLEDPCNSGVHLIVNVERPHD